jgi:hypothetical protein
MARKQNMTHCFGVFGRKCDFGDDVGAAIDGGGGSMKTRALTDVRVNGGGRRVNSWAWRIWRDNDAT